MRTGSYPSVLPTAVNSPMRNSHHGMATIARTRMRRANFTQIGCSRAPPVGARRS